MRLGMAATIRPTLARGQSPAHGGRYRRQAENAADRPYWMYDAVMDASTRPSHAAFDGKVFAWDDPIWDTHSVRNPSPWRSRNREM